MLDFAPLQTLADAIVDAEVRATLDPAALNTPGAWVTLGEARTATLSGSTRLSAVVYLVVDDTDYRRALDGLADLYNTLVPDVLTPDGPVVPQGVLLPDSTTPLPGLRVPVNLY